jgi:uncharacterized membrane protein YeaQ/YmgE (transglycosylase-associated protein family)
LQATKKRQRDPHVGYHATGNRKGTAKSVDIVGWIVVGFLTSVTGELILPGRNPAGIGVTLLLGATGSLLTRFVVGLVWGSGATQFGVEAILWAVLGAFAAITLYRLGVSLRKP